MMNPRNCNENADRLDPFADKDGFVTAKESWIRVLHRLCVAVKIKDGKVMVRDTKDKTNTTLEFTYAEWGAFINGVKRGEFDLPDHSAHMRQEQTCAT